MKIKGLLVVALAGSALSANASILNVWLSPSTQNALVGQTVTVTVYANSGEATPLALSDAYLAMTWDQALVSNATPSVRTETAPWSQSYWAPGSPANLSLTDGDGRRELLGNLPPGQPTAPVGLMGDLINRIEVTTFQFTAMAMGTASVKLHNELPLHMGETTNFYKGDFQIGQWDLAYQNGTYSEALINVVPEPATLSALGLGLAAFLRRRRTR